MVLARRYVSRCCRSLVLARIKMEAEEDGDVELARIKMVTEDPTCAVDLPDVDDGAEGVDGIGGLSVLEGLSLNILNTTFSGPRVQQVVL